MSKIMLVEDDNNLREIYEARLQAEGYTIISAKDGEEALVLAKAEKPDLIISDIMMPKISGFEMLDILRNTDGLKEVKVIMLTALGQNDDQQRADRLGADRYLVKSQVTLEDIVKAAHQLLSDESEEAPAAVTPGESASAPEASPASPPGTATTTVIPVAAEPPEDAPATDGTASSSRIEDFVTGATQEASPPPAAPVLAADDDAAAEPDSSPAVKPDEPAVANDSANAATDDKLVSEAAQKLVDSTEAAEPQPPAAPEAPAAPAEAPAEPPKEKEPEPEEPAAPEPKAVDIAVSTEADSAEDKPETDTGSVPIAHKKVITPLEDTEPKKDLDVLLAIEAANEASESVPPPAAAVVSTNEAGIETAPQVQAPAITPPIGQTVTPTPADETPSAAPAATPAEPSKSADANDPSDPNSIAL